MGLAMIQIVKQRKYIQDFLDFTKSFLLTEQVTINELNLVKGNLDILIDRINEYSNIKIGLISGDGNRGAFVPKEEVDSFINEINEIIGNGSYKGNEENKNPLTLNDAVRIVTSQSNDDLLNKEEIEALIDGIK